MKNNLYSFLLCMCSISVVFGQYGFEYDDSIKVNVGIDTLTNPWAGGLNYAQFSDFDYDFDGDMDLFIFDRSSDNIRVYTQEDDGGKHYEFAYNSHVNFPSDLRYRTALVDFDNDGRKDIFTYGIGGLKVYRNISQVATGLEWELYQELVYSQYSSTYTNLYVSSSDIPAIVDVDNDGDIDILTFSLGGSHVEYHQNQSMDLYGIPDSLIFIQKNECWGKFSEDVATNNVVLNDPNVPCVGGSISNPEGGLMTRVQEKHAGSSLLAFDIDNSGVLDLVLGDASYTNLNLLINGGTAVNMDSPMISADYSFPSNTTPTDIQLFPAAFFIDVDFDDVKDLIVCPNAKNVSFNETSVWFYKNMGTNALPNFIYMSDNFLQDELIDHGSGSIPVYVDMNEDGLEDLIVANFYRYKPILDKESTIAYYQNTGTLTDPHFTFVDDDIFNLAVESYGLKSVPTFGDIDNDNDEDMFIGLNDGTLLYYENNSVGAGAIYGAPIPNYQDNLGAPISSSIFAHPQLFDLNTDGLLDIILGTKTGELIYYENIGTPTVPSFELKNSALGNVDLSTATPDGYSTPHFFMNNSEVQLFVGNIDGKLSYYNDIENNLDPTESFSLVSSNFLDIEVGAYSSFWVNDINNDGNFNLTVGQDLGGLFHFEADPNSNASIIENELNSLVTIYPNPTNDVVFIALTDIEQSANALLVDLKGERIKVQELSNGKSSISLSGLAEGIYFLSIQLEDGQSTTKKIIKTN